MQNRKHIAMASLVSLSILFVTVAVFAALAFLAFGFFHITANAVFVTGLIIAAYLLFRAFWGQCAVSRMVAVFFILNALALAAVNIWR
jgi:hypothetical protein